jgi:hypothetical protein
LRVAWHEFFRFFSIFFDFFKISEINTWCSENFLEIGACFLLLVVKSDHHLAYSSGSRKISSSEPSA